MTESTTTAELHDRFVDEFGKKLEAETHARNAYSPDIKARQSLDAFVADHARNNMLGFFNGEDKNGRSLADMISDPNGKDMILAHAIEYYTHKSTDSFKENPNRIIGDAKDEGLAKIVYMTPAIEVDGNERHNKAYHAHDAFADLQKLVNAYESKNPNDKEPDPEEAVKVLYKYAEEKIRGEFEKDATIKDDEKLLKLTLKAAAYFYGRSQAIRLMAMKNYAVQYKADFEGCFADDGEMAEYVRETTRELARDEKKMPKAMEIVYLADKAAA
jgi:hypothetical protein